jgi:hypothetical protein
LANIDLNPFYFAKKERHKVPPRMGLNVCAIAIVLPKFRLYEALAPLAQHVSRTNDAGLILLLASPAQGRYILTEMFLLCEACFANSARDQISLTRLINFPLPPIILPPFPTRKTSFTDKTARRRKFSPTTFQYSPVHIRALSYYGF